VHGIGHLPQLTQFPHKTSDKLLDLQEWTILQTPATTQVSLSQSQSLYPQTSVGHLWNLNWCFASKNSCAEEIQPKDQPLALTAKLVQVKEMKPEIVYVRKISPFHLAYITFTYLVYFIAFHRAHTLRMINIKKSFARKYPP